MAPKTTVLQPCEITRGVHVGEQPISSSVYPDARYSRLQGIRDRFCRVHSGRQKVIRSDGVERRFEHPLRRILPELHNPCGAYISCITGRSKTTSPAPTWSKIIKLLEAQSLPFVLNEGNHVWQHVVTTFLKAAEKHSGNLFRDYQDLYDWSCDKTSDFWQFTFHYFPIVYEGQVPNPVVDEKARIDTIPKWFHGVKLNFAENVLFTGGSNGRATKSPGKEDGKISCTEVREGCFFEPIRQISWKDLRQRVGQASQALKAHGVGKGDRVALVASNCLNTLVVFLATSTVGAIFSSSSTEMGTKAILDRLIQIEPKMLFMEDSAVYNRKTIDLRPRLTEVVQALNRLPNFKGAVSLPRFVKRPADVSHIRSCQTWQDFLEKAKSSELVFEKLDFSDPFIILYSSGTTGQPKCIVHSVGGIVLSGHKESTLHRQVDHTSVQLQYTTTSWMMYMSSVQLMLTGARLVLYDGSPFAPDIKSFIQLVGREKVTHLGISPRYLQTLQQNKIAPKDVTDLQHLQVVTSTGMVLSDALFEWFYDCGFPKTAQLCNISGGTDIAAAFGTGNPLLSVYVGGAQCVALGMAVSVFDTTIQGGEGVRGRALPVGVSGELVCTKAFPTMPAMFWGKAGAQQYFSNYFEKFDNVWTHGDLIMLHPQTKQIIFLGRADGVLNPSGVRFGSSDIYNVIDAHFSDRVSDSLCVGQRRPQDDDERVILFLVMQPGARLTPKLTAEIKAAIGQEHSKRHIPKYVFETPEIPMTFNRKKVELPIKQIVSGKIVKPSPTIENPGSLDYYYRFAKDENLVVEPRARL